MLGSRFILAGGWPHADVLIAEPDYRITVFGKPNDPSYKSQWHHPKISAPAAWDTVVGTHTVRALIPTRVCLSFLACA